MYMRYKLVGNYETVYLMIYGFLLLKISFILKIAVKMTTGVAVLTDYKNFCEVFYMFTNLNQEVKCTTESGSEVSFHDGIEMLADDGKSLPIDSPLSSVSIGNQKFDCFKTVQKLRDYFCLLLSARMVIDS